MKKKFTVVLAYGKPRRQKAPAAHHIPICPPRHVQALFIQFQQRADQTCQCDLNTVRQLRQQIPDARPDP